MVNVEVKEFKIKVDGQEYTFRLDFKALLKFTSRYKNALDIFNDFLQGKNEYDAMIKILCCACVEREFTEDELARGIPFNFSAMKLFDEITFALIEGVLQEKDGGEEKN